MNALKISKDISLPVEVVTQTIAILAKRRAGKSYTMRRLAEQLIEARQQIILVDPKGDQWGLRSSADGKRPGYPIVILGGEHGDAPLEVSAGEVVAKLVVEERVSVLLDLSSFRKHEIATFTAIFLENLYRLKAQEAYRTPCMLIIDEADAIAPQKPQKGEERMLGAAEDIVRRGGQRGIGCALITQRSAVLNKNVLTQAQMLIVLRTIAPQDLAAMKAWIDVHGTIEEGREMMESLPSLPVGDAWFWSPGWPTTEGIFARSHVLPITTFDSGATPAPGSKPIVPKNLADVDLESLKRQMSATIEKAKNDDPKILRKRIAALELELKTPQKNQVRQPTKMVPDQTLIDRAVRNALIANDRKWQQVVKKWRSFAARMMSAIEIFKQLDISEIPPERLEENSEIPMIKTGLIGEFKGYVRDARPLNLRKSTVEFNSGEKILGTGERAALVAIAQQHGEPMTREHLTVLTGYKRSTRNTYIQRLAQWGLIQVVDDGSCVITDAGREMAGDLPPKLEGSELRGRLLLTLPEGEAKILEILFNAYPEGVDREIISEQSSFTRSTRNTYIQRLGARELVEVVGTGVRAVDNLF